MPKSKAIKIIQEEEEEDDDEEEEEAYEVEGISEHKRKKDGILLYHISWKGYPSSEGHDTWEAEEDVAGASEIVDAYWKKVDPKKAHERYAPGSKESKATLAKATANANGKKRGSDALDSNGSSKAGRKSIETNGNKRAKKDVSEELESPVKKTKGKKVKVEREEVEDDAAQEEEENAYSTDGVTNDTREIELADEPSWEDHVSRIDTVEKGDNGQLRLFIVWEEDDSVSWVDSDKARTKCPQKVIDFYENHLKFKMKTTSD